MVMAGVFSSESGFLFFAYILREAVHGTGNRRQKKGNSIKNHTHHNWESVR